jgi:hypothetical protein
MRPVNISSLTEIKAKLPKETYTAFKAFSGITPKDDEVDDITILAKLLRDHGCNVGHLGNFVLGYKIPQIVKEFDLLRIGKENILNIEVKRQSDPDKALKQLLRNRYYLDATGRQVEYYSFTSDSVKLYRLEGESLREVPVAMLAESLSGFVDHEPEKIDALFKPSDYLVSPFNATDRFLAGQYFLTNQQEEIKVKIAARMDAAALLFALWRPGHWQDSADLRYPAPKPEGWRQDFGHSLWHIERGSHETDPARVQHHPGKGHFESRPEGL